MTTIAGDGDGLEQVAPPDDAGSETQARYRYQAELAVRPCLSLLVHDDIERVICEWHEDYVVCYRSGVTVLVSVKHLEESQPRWTVRGLCVDGGIAHLFDRWRAAEERATCLLQTNTQMRTGNGEPAELRDCCASGDALCLARWAETLTPLLAAAVPAAPTVEEVARFLAVLRIEDDLPKRSDIGASNLADAMPKVTSALGRPASDGPILYETLVREVERASRSEGGRDVLSLIADPSRFDAGSVLADRVQAKTIDKDRLLRALSRPDQALPVMRILKHDNTPSPLVEKLERGGFGPTGISNARNLRLNWEAHVRRWSTDLPVSQDEFDDISTTVLHVAQVAEGRSRVGSGCYGPAMLDVLEAELSVRGLSMLGSAPADPRLLIGCAFALTDECRIWWSDMFELEGSP